MQKLSVFYCVTTQIVLLVTYLITYYIICVCLHCTLSYVSWTTLSNNLSLKVVFLFQSFMVITVPIKLTQSIYILCSSICLFVHLYPSNVKTAEPIGPKFCVGPHMTPGKVYGYSKLQNVCPQVCVFVQF